MWARVASSKTSTSLFILSLVLGPSPANGISFDLRRTTKRAEDVARLQRRLGKRIDVNGAFGNGSRMKFVANHLVAVHNVASAEAMVLGARAGLDPRQIVEVIGGGAGASRAAECCTCSYWRLSFSEGLERKRMMMRGVLGTHCIR